MMMAHRIYIRSRLVDAAMDHPFAVQSDIGLLDRPRIEGELENIVRLHQLGSTRSRHQIASGVGRVPHGHVPERVENPFIRDHAVSPCEQCASFIEFAGHDWFLSSEFLVFYRVWPRGDQSFFASSNPSKEKPGATVQPVNVQEPRLSA